MLDDDILGFQVAMNYSMTVQKRNCFENISYNLQYLILLENLALLA